MSFFSWCQIVRFIMLVPNCPGAKLSGAKLSVFIMLVSYCPGAKLSWCQIVRCQIVPPPSLSPSTPLHHPQKNHLFFQKNSSYYPPYLFSISDNFLFLHRQISSPSPPNSSCAFLLQNAAGLSRTIGSCLGSSILDEHLNLLQIDETNTFLMLNFAVSDGSKLSVST